MSRCLGSPDSVFLSVRLVHALEDITPVTEVEVRRCSEVGPRRSSKKELVQDTENDGKPMYKYVAPTKVLNVVCTCARACVRAVHRI